MSEHAHQLQTICARIGPSILHHITVFHPRRDHAEGIGMRGERHPQQWQDVWMRDTFPNYGFPAEMLFTK